MTIYISLNVFGNVHMILELTQIAQTSAEAFENMFLSANQEDQEVLEECQNALQRLHRKEYLLLLGRKAGQWAETIEGNIRFCEPGERLAVQTLADRLRATITHPAFATKSSADEREILLFA